MTRKVQYNNQISKKYYLIYLNINKTKDLNKLNLKIINFFNFKIDLFLFLQPLKNNILKLQNQQQILIFLKICRYFTMLFQNQLYFKFEIKKQMQKFNASFFIQLKKNIKNKPIKFTDFFYFQFFKELFII